MGDVYIVAEQLAGALSDDTFELLAHGKALAGQTGGNLTAVLLGGDPALAGQLGAASKVITVDCGADFNPESYGAALQAVVSADSPQVVMLSNSAMGMDLAASLAAQADLPLAAYCHSIDYAGGFTAVSQLYGGKLDITAQLGDGPCVVTMLAGSASADAGRATGSPPTEAVAAPAVAGKIRFKQLNMPEAGDVDITNKDILVAIGRGIGSKDDIEVAEELAEALNAAVAASRPIIDAGWLPGPGRWANRGLR